MPLALLLFGILFLTAAVRGKQDLLFSTLKDDFTGPKNFLYWGLALFIIGAAGYYKPVKPLSNAFMLLVVVVLFLSNRGFFNQFMAQIGATQGRNAVSLGLGDVSLAFKPGSENNPLAWDGGLNLPGVNGDWITFK